jgi:hypothetical protein
MQVAPNTVITFDLYAKLSNLSAKFKQLWKKGDNEESGETEPPEETPVL